MALTQPILIGTSGYSYPGPPPKGWYGAFYPDKKAKAFDELKYYSQIFNYRGANSGQRASHTWAMRTGRVPDRVGVDSLLSANPKLELCSVSLGPPVKLRFVES